MLRRGRDPVALHAADQAGRLFSRQERILGIVFKVSAAEGISVDVDARGKPDHDIVFLRLQACCRADLPGQIRIPGAAQQSRAREGGGRNAELRLETDARRSVCGHDARNAVKRIIAVSECVGQAQIGLSSQQAGKILQRKLAHKRVKGNRSLRHILQLFLTAPAEIQNRLAVSARHSEPFSVAHRRQLHVVKVIAWRSRQGLTAAVRQKPLLQVGGGHAGSKLFRNPVFRKNPGFRRLFCAAHISADIEPIGSGLQYPGRFCNLSQVIIAGHLRQREADKNAFCLSGGQKAGLPVAGQLSGRLSKPALRRAVIHLYDFPAGTVAGVRYQDAGLRQTVFRTDLRFSQSETGIAEAEAERIYHLFLHAGNGFKIAVADVDVLCIVDIVFALMKVSAARIVLQIPGIGIRQLAAGAVQTHQKLSRRAASLHTALESHQQPLYPRIFLEACSFHHAAHIHDDNRLFKGGADLFHQRPFSVGQIEISLFKQGIAHAQRVACPFLRLFNLCPGSSAVPAFSGKTADGNHGRVCKRARFAHHGFRQLRFRHHSRHPALRAFRGHIVPIELYGTGIDTIRSVHFRQTVVQIPDIGRRHIAASAAALHIVNRCLSKKCDPAASPERQSPILIFQQYHALPGCPA